MGFRSEKERKRQEKSARAITRNNPGRSGGFVTGRGRGGPSGASRGQPFPTSTNPNAGVVTLSSPSRSSRPTIAVPQLGTRPGDSIIKGGTSTERRAVGIAESALGQVGSPSKARKSQSQQLEKFCEIKIIKGKRKRVCKTKVKAKTKKTKIKKKRKKALGGFFG